MSEVDNFRSTPKFELRSKRLRFLNNFLTIGQDFVTSHAKNDFVYGSVTFTRSKESENLKTDLSSTYPLMTSLNHFLYISLTFVREKLEVSSLPNIMDYMILSSCRR